MTFDLAAPPALENLRPTLAQFADAVRQADEALQAWRKTLATPPTAPAAATPAGPAASTPGAAAGGGAGAGSAVSSSSADPYSFGDQLTAKLTALRQSFGTLQSDAAAALQGGIASGVQDVSRALTEALFHTRNWGQAFLQLGEQIVQTLIAIALKMAVVSGLQAAFGFSGFFANGGPIPAFASGGPMGDGLVARVSPGEWVTRAAAVQNLGAGFMAGLNQNLVDLNRLPPGARVAGLPSGAGTGLAGGAAAPQVINLHFHGDESAALKAAANTPTGRNVIIDTVRQSARQVARGGG